MLGSHYRVVVSLLTCVAAVLGSRAALAQSLPMIQPFGRGFDAEVFIQEGQALEVDVEQLRAIREAGEVIIPAFPLTKDFAVDLRVQRIEPLQSGARVVSVDKFGRERPIARGEAHFLGGSVIGEPGSSVFIAATEAGVFGWVELGESRFIVSSGPYTDQHAPAVFDTASASFASISWVPFSCNTPLLPGYEGGVAPEEGPQGLLGGCRVVDIALDTDQEYLALFGGNQAAALGYLQTLVAGSDEIYRRDLSIQLRLSYARLWTTADPWNGTDSLVQLEQFRAYWQAQMGSVGRDVAHLISPRNLGGGIAWGDALCSSFSYGVCGNMTGFFPTPMVNNSVQNWDIIVFPHELGHNCGAIHTHDYCPPVDQCAPAGYFGSCQTSQVCISNGTIMSYCGLCAGAEANSVLAFHPTSAAEIAGFMATAACAPIGSCSSNPACVLSLSSYDANFSHGGGSQTVVVSTIAPGCVWTPLTVPSWITLTNGGPASGAGSFSYTVGANPSPQTRSFVIQVGDLTHTVTQAPFGDCDGNGISDTVEIAANSTLDCNGNGQLDRCEIASIASAWGAGGPGLSGDPHYGQSIVPAGLTALRSVGAGAYHSIAVRFDRTVVAWGRNSSGQTAVPDDVFDVSAVAGGGSHSVALRNNGLVRCWGLNSDGQCSVPASLTSAIAIAAGNAHTVALAANGTVVCWGSNASGQSAVPSGLSGIGAIAAGTLNTLAMRTAGTVVGWGQNAFGQSAPPATITNATHLASGAVHGVARKADGSIVCWGNNTYGQCTVPAGLGPVARVVAGGYVTIALLADGTARMWGRNDYGQAVLPAGALNAGSFAAGTYHAVAVKTVGTQPDCDGDGVFDTCEIAAGGADCNLNGIPDSCEIAAGAPDANGNGVPDSCEPQTGEPTQWRVADGGNGHWYVVRRNPSPICWDAASALATAMGGYLATITSSQEHGRVTSLTVALQGPTDELGPWIGATCAGRPWGEWYWVTGEPFAYAGWLPSAPNPGWNEEYVHLWRWLDGRWNDGYRCGTDAPTTVHGYVIEWSADCNSDGIVDYGQILSGQLPDTDGNGVPDGCVNTTPSCPGANTAVTNDCAQDAIVVTGDATLAFTNIGCNTDGPAHPAATCESGNDVFLNDIWYRAQATANGTMRVSTCNQVDFDTKLALYGMGTSPASFNYSALSSAFIACNDDGDAACQATAIYASDLSITVSAGNWYLIRVAAYTTPGSGSVTIDMPEPCALPSFTGVETEACGTSANNGCNGGGAQPIAAGARIKGTIWANGGVRDVDYYSLNVTGERAVTARVYSASFVTCQILGGDISAPNCSGLTVLESGSGTCPTEGTICLRTGTYYIAIANAQADGNPCGNGVLNEYVLEVDTAPAYCPVQTAGTCAAPGPNTVTINSSSTVDYGVARCVNEPTFPSCSAGGSRANSYARSFPSGAVRGSLSCVTFGVWSNRRVGNAANNGCALIDSDIPLPAKVGVYRDLDGGAPRNKIAAGGDGNDLELIAERDVLIPGSHTTQTLSFTPPICVDSAANYSLVIVVDFPNLSDGSTGIPADSGYQLLAGGNSAGGASQTYARLSCADSGQYRLMESINPAFTQTWYVSVNGDWNSCEGVADCNGDGLSDSAQIRGGSLADFDGNLIPDCCEQGAACTSGNYPVQWRINDGGDGHWYRLQLATPGISWEAAHASAQAIGGHLATLTSLAENAFAFGLSNIPAAFGGSPVVGPWIGGRLEGGAWAWVTGEPWSFTNWLPPNPDGPGVWNENRTCLTSDAGRWNDFSGSGSQPGLAATAFIIEWSADCNNDGIVDYGQILTGQLADSDANGVPDICERPTDINRDGVVNGGDLALLLDNWGGTGTGDVDGDGTVGGGDLTLVLNDWG